MMITLITPLLKQIQEAQVEAMKEEYQKSEVSSFDYDSQGIIDPTSV